MNVFKKNEVIGPIFEERIQNKWPEHIEKMYRFWQTILLGEHAYNGAPFPPNERLPIDEQHFIVWVQNFTKTIDDFFEGPVSEEVKKR